MLQVGQQTHERHGQDAIQVRGIIAKAPDTTAADNPYERAACAADNVNPDWFFPADQRSRQEVEEEGGSWAAYKAFVMPAAAEDEARAKLICAGCPIRLRCLDDNLSEEFGVYGGMSAGERSRFRRTGEAPKPRPQVRLPRRMEAAVLEFRRGGSADVIACNQGVTREMFLRNVNSCAL